ncbi:hypothetical protein LYSHEL_19460 [Lysobacter helvus]|uniref:Uncharacterized protein n=2 Tax=Lysobacteraceae TaxID=32033 RepID=A0ABN6FZC4_9GAMM|nr:hypothetical protein LYSCAS_19470 [Lysobacter caseinilyticus]BCT96075.1 hypothetical protein LYSHEL_19460 [Lysobacter helvus]
MPRLSSRLPARASRWFAALSRAWQAPRASQSFTLRELLRTLESAGPRDTPPPPRLARLLAKVSGDLAVAVRDPERRGGPDTLRPLATWKSRYSHLDRYLPRA